MTDHQTERPATIPDAADVERWALEAAIDGPDCDDDTWVAKTANLARFATLVRAAALEEAAKIAEGYIDPEWPGDDLSAQAEVTAAAIRASITPKA